jgi:hypothetical protein
MMAKKLNKKILIELFLLKIWGQGCRSQRKI